jgi:hypothetical protein
MNYVEPKKRKTRGPKSGEKIDVIVISVEKGPIAI